MSSPHLPLPITPLPRQKNRWWLWFFTFVGVASVGVATFMVWFNLRMQLTLGEVEAAMQRWSEHGPASYKLVFSRQIKDEPPEQWVVLVRQGKVIEARRNGELLRDEDKMPLPAGHKQLQWYSMDYLLRDIEVFLEQDEREKRKVYNVATFDAVTGALEKYTRSDRARGVHIVEQVKVEPLAP